MKENEGPLEEFVEFKNFILNFRGSSYSNDDLIILNNFFHLIPILDQIHHTVRNKVKFKRLLNYFE